jgi:hypothetical protein
LENIAAQTFDVGRSRPEWPSTERKDFIMISMKPLLVAAAFATSVSSAGFAAEATGTIRSISKPHDTLTLSNGHAFHLPEGIETERFRVGEHVKVAYGVGKHKVRMATAVTPLP